MGVERCELLCLDLPKAEALRRSRLSSAAACATAARFKAFADPTRLTVATAMLEGGELCVCDLAWICERAENLISHHLKVLHGEGLVAKRPDGKMALYSLTESGHYLLQASAAAGALAR